MSDIQHMLERQAAWQKNRAGISWPDKIRMVEDMQDTLRRLRALNNNRQGSGKKQQAEPQQCVTE